MEINAGDIGFVTNHTWNSPFTRFFLQINRLRMGRPVKKKHIYGHVFTVAEKDGKKYICEAVKGGWHVDEFPGQYKGREKDIEWKEPSTTWSNNQKVKFSEECFKFKLDRTGYDVPGYLWQICFTVFGWWFGKTGKKAEKKVTCAESIPTIVNNAFKEDIFKCDYMMNPFTLYIDSYYKTKK